jgi:hypothetical protein
MKKAGMTNRSGFKSLVPKDDSYEQGGIWCFRNLLLVIRLQLLFPKALALHCGLTRVGETKFGFNQLLPKCLRQSDQQLMTEAPSSNQSNHRSGRFTIRLTMR